MQALYYIHDFSKKIGQNGFSWDKSEGYTKISFVDRSNNQVEKTEFDNDEENVNPSKLNDHRNYIVGCFDGGRGFSNFNRKNKVGIDGVSCGSIQINRAGF